MVTVYESKSIPSGMAMDTVGLGRCLHSYLTFKSLFGYCLCKIGYVFYLLHKLEK